MASALRLHYVVPVGKCSSCGQIKLSSVVHHAVQLGLLNAICCVDLVTFSCRSGLIGQSREAHLQHLLCAPGRAALEGGGWLGHWQIWCKLASTRVPPRPGVGWGLRSTFSHPTGFAVVYMVFNSALLHCLEQGHR